MIFRKNGIELFEVAGGLVSGTERSVTILILSHY